MEGTNRITRDMAIEQVTKAHQLTGKFRTALYDVRAWMESITDAEYAELGVIDMMGVEAVREYLKAWGHLSMCMERGAVQE